MTTDKPIPEGIMAEARELACYAIAGLWFDDEAKLNAHVEFVAPRIANAIMAERERCAPEADKYGYASGIAKRIGAAIRNGG